MHARTRLVLLAVGLLALAVIPAAVTAVTLTTFSNGAVADATQVNGNFAALANALPRINVRSTTKTDVSSIATNVWTDIPGLSVTITPQLNTSKVLVTVSVSHCNTDPNDTAVFRITRNGAQTIVGDAGLSNQLRATFAGRPVDVYTLDTTTFTFLDDPGTTSAVTYTLQTRRTYSYPGTIRINTTGSADNEEYNPRAASTITAMEIHPGT